MKAKEFLDQIRKLKLKIANKEKELEFMGDMAKSLSSPQLGGISNSTKNTTPSYVRYLEKKENIQSEIDFLNEELIRVTADVESKIDTLDDARFKSVMVYRHIFGMTWKETSLKLGYTERWTVEIYKTAFSEFEIKNSAYFTPTSS